MAVEGQFVLSTEGGNTRKWRRTGAALPPGAGAGTGHRAPGGGGEATALFGVSVSRGCSTARAGAGLVLAQVLRW